MALTYGSTWPVDRKYVGHSTLSFYGTWPHTTCSHNSYTATVRDSMSSRAVNGTFEISGARPTFMNTIHNMLKGPFSIVSLTPEGTFNKVKALVGAFSGHREIREGSLTALF